MLNSFISSSPRCSFFFFFSFFFSSQFECERQTTNMQRTHTKCFKTNHCPIVKVSDESYENRSLFITRDGKAPISNWDPCHENHCQWDGPRQRAKGARAPPGSKIFFFLVYKIFIKKAWAPWFLAWAPLTSPIPVPASQPRSFQKPIKTLKNIYIYVCKKEKRKKKKEEENLAVSKTPKPNRKARNEGKKEKNKRKERERRE